MAIGTLFVVGTPIGNLDDFSTRGVETLRAVDVVAAEDTRHSGRLFTRYGISTRMVAYHEHNEEEQAASLIERILTGENVALISDAGTPLVSDPGYRLVRLALDAGIPVSPVPGPSAVTAALSVCGLATDRFAFQGFLPAKRTARLDALQEFRAEPRSQVFFESSHRIVDSLRDLAETFGHDRPACICRELTKQFETTLRGSLSQLAQLVSQDRQQQKGEFVIVVAGYELPDDDRLARGLEIAAALTEHLPASQAARIAAKLSGASRRAIYEALLQSAT